jgi:hypothetical protein
LYLGQVDDGLLAYSLLLKDAFEASLSGNDFTFKILPGFNIPMLA